MITDKLHHLRGEFLGLVGAVADACMVHQISQAHDPQSNSAGAESGFLELRNSGNIGIGANDIIQKTCG